MKDKVMGDRLAVAAAWTMQDGSKKLPTGCPCGTITSYHRNSANHFAKDCMGSYVERQKPEICCYRCNEIGHISQNCPRNNPGEETLAPICSPNPHLNKRLPVIIVCINRIKVTALVDTGWLWSLVSRTLYHSWKRRCLLLAMRPLGAVGRDLFN